MDGFSTLAFRSALICLSTVLLATFASAQSASPTAAPPKNLIHVTTNEVTVPVTATTRRGEVDLNLSQHDFHVFDNGVEQKIDHWELGGDPLFVALVLDASSRVHSSAAVIHSLGIIFTNTVMALDSQAAVITYGSSVAVRQPFTANHDAVEKAMEATKFDESGMDLYDGMAAAARLLETQPANWRRIMLIVGESQDGGSLASLGQVLREANQANIAIYVVGESSVGADLRSGKLHPTPLKIRGLPPITAAPCIAQVPGYGATPCRLDIATNALWLLERGTNEIKHHQLAVAASATGGIAYSGFHEAALQGALDKIGGQLHAQYILTYRPPSNSAPGFHTLRVTVDRPGVIVRARPGYYFKAPSQRDKP